MTAHSRTRKPCSPSLSKMNVISTPVRRSISLSLSTNSMSRCLASFRPTAVFPEPMGPTRTTLDLLFT